MSLFADTLQSTANSPLIPAHALPLVKRSADRTTGLAGLSGNSKTSLFGNVQKLYDPSKAV